jgi:pyrroloquinoline quinone biosynthesis protein B
MKLRVDASDEQGSGGLMLSPGEDAWCRIDAGRVTPGDECVNVVLTGMQREQVGGLLDLRDGAPLELYATPAVFEHLTDALPVLPVLQQFCGVQWHLIPVAGEQYAAEFSVERLPELSFTALTSGDALTGERIALAVRDERSGARLFVVHGASLEAAGADALLDWVRAADCVVIDRAPHGTQWLDRLSQAPGPRKLLLDLNGCRRHQALIEARGVECAHGPMEFEL